jgi:hypothetical protein
MMFIGVVLILLGALGPVAGAQWRRGAWMGVAKTLRAETSPRLVATVPMLGAFIASVGLALIWSLFIWLAFVMAIAWLIRLASMSWARMRAEAEAERRGAGEVELPVTAPDAREERRAS